jgi:chromosome segregation ATPase
MIIKERSNIMKTHIKILMILSLMLSPLFSGCSGGQNPVRIVFPPEFGGSDQPQNAANPKRFEEQNSAHADAIEKALEMSEKCSKLTAETTELQKQNENLQQEKQLLSSKLQQTKAELERTQKELSQANDLIMETRVELNDWKSDVLGFREEMRQADIAQLQALKKIVELLGGEVPQQLAVADDAVQTQPTLTDPNTMQ